MLDQDKRVVFDFEITFLNGGSLQGQEFRLDIEDVLLDDEQLGKYVIKDLRLLMVEKVEILNKKIIAEAHKRPKVSNCTEFSVFKVSLENKQRVIELSHLIFSEMNKDEKVILSYDILENTHNKEELSWYLLWVNKEVAQNTTAKWPTFPSTKEFQGLVGDNLYYGHLESVIK